MRSRRSDISSRIRSLGADRQTDRHGAERHAREAQQRRVARCPWRFPIQVRANLSRRTSRASRSFAAALELPPEASKPRSVVCTKCKSIDGEAKCSQDRETTFAGAARAKWRWKKWSPDPSRAVLGPGLEGNYRHDRTTLMRLCEKLQLETGPRAGHPVSMGHGARYRRK